MGFWNVNGAVRSPGRVEAPTAAFASLERCSRCLRLTSATHVNNIQPPRAPHSSGARTTSNSKPGQLTCFAYPQHRHSTLRIIPSPVGPSYDNSGRAAERQPIPGSAYLYIVRHATLSLARRSSSWPASSVVLVVSALRRNWSYPC